MNRNNGKNSIYEYYIYLPSCEDKNYSILNSINENKSEENFEKISNFLTVKTNKYYFEIKNFPDEYGYFTLNNEKVNDKILINNSDYILDFIVTNRENSSNTTITVDYIVSIEDDKAYSNECQIKLNFLKTKEIKAKSYKDEIKDIIKDLLNNERNKTEKSKEEEIKFYDNILNIFESKYISDNYDTSNIDIGKDDIYNIEKMIITITTTQNKKNNINNNMTRIDLGKCEALLRNYYNISINESLYIKKIDIEQNGMKTLKVEYEVYAK